MIAAQYQLLHGENSPPHHVYDNSICQQVKTEMNYKASVCTFG